MRRVAAVGLLGLGGCLPSGMTAYWADTGLSVDELHDTGLVHGDTTVSCDGFEPGWAWSSSEPFTGAGHPTDGAGEPFFSTDHDDGSWLPVELPDQDLPAGLDRAYRASFHLDHPAPRLLLDLSSDDGLWVWVNGVEVGHWGGDWQQEGCVNDGAGCTETVYVDPVDIGSRSVVGRNLVAVRLSNAVDRSWLDIRPRCVED